MRREDDLAAVRGLLAAMAFAVLIWAVILGVALADQVVVRWQPATEYEPLMITQPDGTSETVIQSLDPWSAWTFIAQFAGTCPPGDEEISEAPLDGVGRWNGVPDPYAIFTQAKGSCACYEGRSIAWRDPPENRVSRPARAEKCLSLHGCH